MDRPQPVTRELKRDLANLRSLNRWFGSHRLVRHFLRRWLKPNDKARILVADLRRARLLTWGVYFVTATIYRDAMTKTDARLSAVRAFSFGEMHKVAECAGWRNFGHQKFAVGRQAIWIESSSRA